MNNTPYIIGVAGGSGSGKTFFLKNFLHHFEANEISLISQDDYYIPAGEMTQEENKLYNFDLPSTIDDNHFLADINKLLAGETIFKKEYNFNTPLAETSILEIKPAPIIIVEGLFILHFEHISQLLKHRIFIDADEKIALQRRIKRDALERGYSEEDVTYKWINHVLPSYENYLLPHKEKCDQIILNNTNDGSHIKKLTEQISTELRNKLR
ncbi:MAG: uridine kinase [Sphingobacteriaceae bacterium]|nr:uridine kinase [Sphingobacteriaceae bacterium]